MPKRLKNAVETVKGFARLASNPVTALRWGRYAGQTQSMATMNGMIRLLEYSEFTRDYCAWYSNHSKWIPEFNGKYLGEDCFLMGNGPSLNKVDLPKLNRHHIIGLNKIHLLLERQSLDLTFHVSVNRLVIEQSWQEFTKLRCPSFLSYLPARGQVPDKGNIHYILTDQRAVPRFSHIAYEPFWEGSTVTNVALQLAFFMGFRRVFLIGVDHNFVASGKPNEEQKLQGNDANHFDPRYFSNQQWHLPDLEGSEMAYQVARFAFEKNGRSIIDATIGGKCTVFPKMEISQAFAECRPKGEKS